MRITRTQALHEAGHAVVADALGFVVRSIEQHPDGPICTIFVPSRLSKSDRFLAAAYGLGGGAATLRAGGTPGPECALDLRAAARDAKRCRVIGGRAMERAAWLAQSIVNDRWTVVRKLAAHVVKHQGASERDVRRILGGYREGASTRTKRGPVRPKRKEGRGA